MPRLLSVAMLADMFLPLCAVVFAWRFLPDDLAFKLFLVSIAWFIFSLLGFAVLRFSMTRSNQFTLLFDGPRLVLMKNDDILKEFNLDREHRLLVVVKELMDRRIPFYQRWAEVHLSQGPERFLFQAHLRVGDLGRPSPPGEESGLLCVLEYGRLVRGPMRLFGPALSHYEWEASITGSSALELLKDMDSFSANNALLPAIEKAKAGGMSLGK